MAVERTGQGKQNTEQLLLAAPPVPPGPGISPGFCCSEDPRWILECLLVKMEKRRVEVKLKTCDWKTRREGDENTSCSEEMLINDRINCSQENNVLRSALIDEKPPAKVQVFLQANEYHAAGDEREP